MAHRGVPYELHCFHGSEVSIALDQGRLRRLNRGLADQDGFRFLVRSEMFGLEEQVLRGEAPETVLRDLRNRFGGKYAQAVGAVGGDTPTRDVTV